MTYKDMIADISSNIDSLDMPDVLRNMARERLDCNNIYEFVDGGCLFDDAAAHCGDAISLSTYMSHKMCDAEFYCYTCCLSSVLFSIAASKYLPMLMAYRSLYVSIEDVWDMIPELQNKVDTTNDFIVAMFEHGMPKALENRGKPVYAGNMWLSAAPSNEEMTPIFRDFAADYGII